MIRYKIYQNQQKKGVNAGKWFARSVADETFDLAKLAEHMSQHSVFWWCYQRCAHRYGRLYQRIVARRQERKN